MAVIDLPAGEPVETCSFFATFNKPVKYAHALEKTRE